MGCELKSSHTQSPHQQNQREFSLGGIDYERKPSSGGLSSMDNSGGKFLEPGYLEFTNPDEMVFLVRRSLCVSICGTARTQLHGANGA